MDIFAQSRWQPHMGDPTLMGWVTVVTYFGLAILSVLFALSAKQRAGSSRSTSTQVFLWSLAFILLLLGLNKLTNYISLITQYERALAIREGWFGERRVIQYTTIRILLFSILPIFGLLCWYFRGVLRYYWFTLLSTLFLLVFVVIRAISWHYVDVLINRSILGLRINWVLELGTLLLIALSLLSAFYMQER